MQKRVFRIAGRAPKVKWKRNTGRKRRTIQEAIAIAKDNGVSIPDDFDFRVADRGELRGTLKELLDGGEMDTAMAPSVTQHEDGYVYWRDHYDERVGTILIHIHPDIFLSDEAIVGTFAHEMYELAEFREVFENSPKRRMYAADYGKQCSADYEDNTFHSDAWSYADKLVLKMREKSSDN